MRTLRQNERGKLKAHKPRTISESSPSSSDGHKVTNARNLIDFTTVYANEQLSQLFSDALLNPNTYHLADEAVHCIPLLVAGSKQWLGYSNVSNSILSKLVRLLRKQKSRSDFCLLALAAILDLCGDKDVTHDPNVLRFSDLSTLKVVVKVLDDQLKASVELQKRNNVYLNLIARRWQKFMNIDDNIRNSIFQYLFSQKRQDAVVQLCCQAIIELVESNLSKVVCKVRSTSGLSRILIDVMNSSVSTKVKCTALTAIQKLILRGYGPEQVHLGICEALSNNISGNISDVSFVRDAIVTTYELLSQFDGRNHCDWKLGTEIALRKVLSANVCEVLLKVIFTHKDVPMAWSLLAQIADFSEVSTNRTAAADLRNLFLDCGITDAINAASAVDLKDYYFDDLIFFMESPKLLLAIEEPPVHPT
jgi:hypothetical protein